MREEERKESEYMYTRQEEEEWVPAQHVETHVIS